jgi:thymidylate synthase ThyX
VTEISDRVEQFTDAERARLAPYFTNLDGHVFALTNLPETVKGALFARYSRSAKSLRRLFLDEFADEVGQDGVSAGPAVGLERAEKLYAKVFNEYGDDSVAQLGGAHIACEYASNVLTKVLEWGRLMAYLEQSTRYVPYTDKLHGRWRYHIPAELPGPQRDRYVRTLDDAFERYAKWIHPMQEHFARRHPKAAADSDAVHRSAVRAKALDTLRGMLPAATQSNVGVFGTGQAFEALLLRMHASPLEEVRACAGDMLRELRKVIPAFLVRVDQPDRGGRWSQYLAGARAETASVAADLIGEQESPERDEVTLTDFDPEGETKIVAAALYAVSDLPDDRLLALAKQMSADERARVLQAYVGERANRRHRPGRAFERTAYRFDVLTDYGAFRDLQRHRLLTLEWQPLLSGAPRRHPACRAARRGAVCRGDGLQGPLLSRDERARSHAPHRAAHSPPRASCLPARLPAHAPAHRRSGRPPRRRGGDDVRRSFCRRAREAWIGARARTEEERQAVAGLWSLVFGLWSW